MAMTKCDVEDNDKNKKTRMIRVRVLNNVVSILDEHRLQARILIAQPSIYVT